MVNNKCAHQSFFCEANIGRLSTEPNGPVTGYSADIKIKCSDCNMPFRFIGLSGGVSFAEPRISVDGTELRAPIEPAEHEKFAAVMKYDFPGNIKH